MISNTKLAILAVVAAVLVVVTVLLYADQGKTPTRFESGTPLIPGLTPEKVSTVVINDGNDVLTLQKNEEGFVVVEKDNYPASVSEINSLLVDALDIRCKKKVTSSPENHDELGVNEKKPADVVVSLLNSQGDRIVGFVKGRSVPNASGAYVRRLGENDVYETEDYLRVSTSATSYMDKELVDVEKDKIRKITVKLKDEVYVIARNEDGDVRLLGVPEEKEAKQSQVDGVFNALSGFRFSDVFAADKKQVEWDATYRCDLKSGLSCVLRTAEKNDSYYVKLGAEGPGVEQVTITKTESEESLKKKDELLQAQDKAKEINETHRNWVYEVSSWKAKKLRNPFEDLVKDKPKEEAPDEIAARHILISHKEAEKSDTERTRAEAKTLAKKVLSEAKREGADFAKLAREYSDGPTAEKGGDLGTFGKGQMDPAFEKAAFKLKVGEISDVVETPFGFHIIKRTGKPAGEKEGEEEAGEEKTENNPEEAKDEAEEKTETEPK
ncbi:MAG: peptidylprolyl isomerase [Candidatus Brocadiia bacterium]